MKKILLVSFMFVSLLGFNKAQAGFLVEPHFGILLNSEYDGASSGHDVTGNTLGVKLGWNMIGLNFGLNYRQGSHEVDFKDGGESDGDLTQYSLFVGYNFPVMFRIWGEYVLSNSTLGGDFNDLEDASGTVIGLGYKVMPFVSLNLEIGNYGFGEDGDGNDVDADFNTYTLGVSFPFTL